MTTLHLTSGDVAGLALSESGVPGEVFVWHDILYDGPPRKAGWPDEKTLHDRAAFLEQTTGGGLTQEKILPTLMGQYRKLRAAEEYDRIVLWFDACLFDQSMLAHVLACLDDVGCGEVDILCVDAFSGVEPFHGLGQLTPEQLASCYDRRTPATKAQFDFARRVDEAFASQDATRLSPLAQAEETPLPHVPTAMARWLREQPDPETGLGQLDQFILEALRAGNNRPEDIFRAVSAADTPPQFWGDTTLWCKINALADRQPPRLSIDGPAKRLPQWESDLDLSAFRISET